MYNNNVLSTVRFYMSVCVCVLVCLPCVYVQMWVHRRGPQCQDFLPLFRREFLLLARCQSSTALVLIWRLEWCCCWCVLLSKCCLPPAVSLVCALCPFAEVSSTRLFSTRVLRLLSFLWITLSHWRWVLSITSGLESNAILSRHLL